MILESVWWSPAGDGVPAGVGYIDQRRIPHDVIRSVASSVDDIVETIATLAVRGAPAIGIFGAYGVALARELYAGDRAAFRAAASRIRGARPTAVNLAWAVDRVLCNTGPLATGGSGTALAVFFAAHNAGKKLHVYVDETRPLLQGARLTTFELAQAGVPATLIADGAAAATMRAKKVTAVVVGADRIARNGDTANKIGTYGVAIAAAHHGIPFYIAAPRSTIDFETRDGAAIEIEERAPGELRALGGVATAPADVAVYNPAFDVTPGRLIAGIITEYGVARPPYDESIPDLATRPAFGLLHR